MKKTLYSLMLDEDIVREVDILAHRLGTNRSNLVNEILAEYVNYTTPEKRINDVLSAVEELMKPSRELVPFFAPHSYSMSLKSSLAYKYRPTIKYEVELYRGDSERLGSISVLFRTQSISLIESITDFFRLWKRIEDVHLAPYAGRRPDYSLYEGRLERSILKPGVNCSSDELASAISGYISLFDSCLKSYLSGGMTPAQIENAYLNRMGQGELVI